MRTLLPFLVNALVSSFILLYMISQLYLYPNNAYGVVVLVGLMFATIICYIRGFVTYNLVVHNSCNMGIHDLPDIYTLSHWDCGSEYSDAYIRQTILTRITAI